MPFTPEQFEGAVDIGGVWERIAAEDPALGRDDPEMIWYSLPGLQRLKKQDGVGLDPIHGEIDPDFTQPPASSSVLRRLHTSGRDYILKELQTAGLYYTGSTVAQALTLAGEQFIGALQFPSSRALSKDSFYKGVFVLEEQDSSVALRPYHLGDRGRVVSVMDEIETHKPLSRRIREGSVDEVSLASIYKELARRAMTVQFMTPSFVQEQYGSWERIRNRIVGDTPGMLRDGFAHERYPYLQEEAAHFIAVAETVLREDGDLREYLIQEPIARRGGDMRADNVLLNQDGSLAVVIDQINLFRNPGTWAPDRVTPAPWGINSASYELAFMLPDLLAVRADYLAQHVVDAASCSEPDFDGLKWGDVDAIPIRALMLWTATKAIEIAGFSTFDMINERKRGRYDEEGLDHQENLISRYGKLGVETIEMLA